jgi:hypothetical protein
MDQTIRLDTKSIRRPLFLLRKYSLYVDKKRKGLTGGGKRLECKIGALSRSSAISDIPHCITLRYGQFQSHTCILNATDVHQEWLIFILKPGKHFSLQLVKHCHRDEKRINPEIYQSFNKHKM